MQITHVGIQGSGAALAAGRPTLTPELLASVMARYSRSDEGLFKILEKVDRLDPDASVDTIFKHVDYGHQSIADMVPVPMFMDGLSLFSIYEIFRITPTGSGQETSTRYCKFSRAGLPEAPALGIGGAPRGDAAQQGEWEALTARLFLAYGEAYEIWQSVFAQDPAVAKIPKGVIDAARAGDDKAGKTLDRMQRNYAFDRARYFIPFASKNNMCLILSARDWVKAIQELSAHPLPELRQIAAGLKDELQLVAPRMVRHATVRDYWKELQWERFGELQAAAHGTASPHLHLGADRYDAPATAFLETWGPGRAWSDQPHGAQLAAALRHHPNRYAPVGHLLERLTVRYGWEAVAIAELRDLNRHRPGNKYAPLVPLGFYCALDQFPFDRSDPRFQRLVELSLVGAQATARARELLGYDYPDYIYYAPIGAQFFFEHTNQGDKYLYEAELRTGTGCHFRYVEHLRDSLALWYHDYPETQGLVLEGQAEPE